VSIKVDRNGSTLFDGEFVTEDQVMPRLFGLHQQNPDIKVSISAEEQALHGAVITLLDHVRSAGIKKVGYQIKPAVVGP
ncbi:MAG: biopolymer transporter ExbD, partial [Chthoniobacterales bacterium]